MEHLVEQIKYDINQLAAACNNLSTYVIIANGNKYFKAVDLSINGIPIKFDFDVSDAFEYIVIKFSKYSNKKYRKREVCL